MDNTITKIIKYSIIWTIIANICSNNLKKKKKKREKNPEKKWNGDRGSQGRGKNIVRDSDGGSGVPRRGRGR